MLKYQFINEARFRNGLSIPLFQVFDTEENKIFYKAYVFGRDTRGKLMAKDSFEHDHKSKVVAWRQSRSHDAR